MQLSVLILSGCCLGLLVMGSAVVQGAEIAGLSPSVRPAGAPVIADFQRDQAWYQRALTGVEPPYPASLRFLEDQGAWFTPFNHPGMTGPYDLRQWHQSAEQGQPAM